MVGQGFKLIDARMGRPDNWPEAARHAKGWQAGDGHRTTLQTVLAGTFDNRPTVVLASFCECGAEVLTEKYA